MGNAIAVGIQLAEGEMPILPFALGVVTEWFDHGNGIGHGFGHFRQPGGDVKRMIHYYLSWQLGQNAAIPIDEVG